METYAHILLIASPVFFILVMSEHLYGYVKFKHNIKSMDTISSLTSGYTNTIKDILGLSITILSYQWFYKHFAVFHIKSSIWLYIIAFISLDFSGYWVHRWAHKYNFFWNKHAIHHSSEEFNLACALRQSISSFFNIFTFLLLPAAILGVPTEVIAVVGPIQFFAQFWYHTTYINKMGFLEKILVTPSHHRVHHAINPEYIDKNHAQIFIVWDKLFGTFQEELPSVPAVFGITRPADTWNPIKINFQHLALLIKDAWRAENWKDKFTIWFKPTGWRPAGFEDKYPVKKINDPYHFRKYRTDFNLTGRIWVWFQFLFTFGMLYFFYYQIPLLSITQMLIYGAFVYCNIYAYTEFMDQSPWAWQIEILKNVLGVLIFIYSGIFSNMFENFDLIKNILLIYFVASSFITFVLSKSIPHQTRQMSINNE